MSVYDYQDEQAREDSLEAAHAAIREGKLIVLPTDTVYGIGADAFNAEAVQALLEAKGRGRDVPPPVLVGDSGVLHALGVDFPPIVEDLVDEYWPGALTIIVKAQPSLMWDLGETAGTVALRMPNHEAALALLKKTGPLAVSSANRHGKEAATSIMNAATQLGDAVEVYIDAGTSPGGVPSTIIDATVDPIEILRPGAISEEEIVEKFGPIFTPEDEPHESEEPVKNDSPAPDESAVKESGTAEDADAVGPATDHAPEGKDPSYG